MISTQFIKFGVVGVSAMLVHLLVVMLFVSLGLHPLLANIIGFLVAFQLSYFGHSRWTFELSDPNNSHRIRFFSVAILSFLINEAAYFVLLRYWHIDYRIILIIVLFAVAVITFVLSRLWAFRG